jgi:hypothetical protein
VTNNENWNFIVSNKQMFLLYRCVEEYCKCPYDLLFNDCGTACPITCEMLHEDVECNNICVRDC